MIFQHLTVPVGSFTYTIPDFLDAKNELELFLTHRSNRKFLFERCGCREEAKRRFWDLEFETGTLLTWHHLDWFSSAYSLSYKRVNMRTIDEENTLTPEDVDGVNILNPMQNF